MAENGARRRLAAILSADVVGYSRLMADDDRATLETLKRYRAAIGRIVESHDGRVVNAPGDALLAEFASAREALAAAVEVQRGIEARNEELPEARRMRFRIGLSVGDVLVEPDGTLYGDGVNIAARMEALSEAGGICLSSMVHDHVRGEALLGFEDLGPQQVKNFADPVRAYKVLPARPAQGTPGRKPRPGNRIPIAIAAAIVVVVIAGAALLWQPWREAAPPGAEVATAEAIEPAAVERMAYPLPDKPSVAVLPFDNLSATTEHDYLADGLAENIIAALSQLPDLFVIARNSTFAYKGQAVKVQQVAEELGVRYVLEGSLQVSGERTRVTAQLIDALSGDHVWSGRYDRPLADIFALQDEITLNVGEGLQLELTEGVQARYGRRGTQNLEAWLQFWQGHEAIDRHSTKADLAQSRSFLQEAVRLDPSFALARVYLGRTYWIESLAGWSDNYEQAIDNGIAHVEKALSLDVGLPDAYAMRALFYVQRGNDADARAFAERAVDLDPNHADAVFALAASHVLEGRTDEAIVRGKQAMRLNPRYPPYYIWAVEESYRRMGRYEEQVELSREYAARTPILFPRLRLIYGLMKLGRTDEVAAAVRTLLDEQPDFSLAREREVWMRRGGGTQSDVYAEMFDVLREAGLPERPPTAAPERPSIAVLPFDNLSGDPSQDYFADGLTEEIIGTLARYPDLAVIARNSTFRYKGQAVDARAVGAELDVKYLVEGSVRRGGETVRVTAQLIDTETGAHVWSESYDRALTVENLFAIQDDVARAIATALADRYGVVREAGLAAARRKPPAELGSYDCVLLAMEHFRTLSEETNKAARRCLERAVESDPDYAAAWLYKAIIYVNAERMDYDPPPGALDDALAAAERAVRLAPGEAAAHWSLAYAHFFRGERDAFLAEANRAVSMADEGASVRGDAGLFLAYAGEWDRGLALLEEAAAADPHHPGWYHAGAFFDHYRKGEYAQALAAAQRMGLPDYVWTNACVAAAYGELGEQDVARPYVEKILALDPDFEQTARANRWKWFRYQEDLLDHFMDGLRKAGLDIPPAG